jgi:hypothetical protein
MRPTHRQGAYIYIKDGGKGLRTRPPDRNGGATRPVDHGKARDQRLRSEFCTPAFPCPFEMQDAPAIMVDDKETVEDAECDRWHCEEVHCRNRFPVILKKRTPALGWLGFSRRPLHPAGDDSLGDVKAQQEKLAVNARRAPGWVLRRHTEDQLSNFRRQFFPTDLFSRLRDQTPGSKIPQSCR